MWPRWSSTRGLYCLVEGDHSVFRVEVPFSCLVCTLKEIVYEKCKNSAPGLDPKDLILWKVSLPAVVTALGTGQLSIRFSGTGRSINTCSMYGANQTCPNSRADRETSTSSCWSGSLSLTIGQDMQRSYLQVRLSGSTLSCKFPRVCRDYTSRLTGLTFYDLSRTLLSEYPDTQRRGKELSVPPATAVAL